MRARSILPMIGVPVGALALIILPSGLWAVAALITGLIGGSLLERRAHAIPFAAVGTLPYVVALLSTLSHPKSFRLAELLSAVVGLPTVVLVSLPAVVYFAVTAAAAISLSTALRLVLRRSGGA
ncbi:MAG: hypothetical protein NZ953_00045 [Thaumarchaeota archaeon]|nr:hypothetical protein [Candidatus Calditenuaceae archaeon]